MTARKSGARTRLPGVPHFTGSRREPVTGSADPSGEGVADGGFRTNLSPDRPPEDQTRDNGDDDDDRARSRDGDGRSPSPPISGREARLFRDLAIASFREARRARREIGGVAVEEEKKNKEKKETLTARTDKTVGLTFERETF